MPSLTTATRSLRAGREFLRGLLDTEHPLLVHIVPIRRCNIDCGYCNEYDKVSPPIPFEVVAARIDKLAELGTSVVAFSGGEPMLHPQLDDLIRHIRSHRMMAGLITNGYFLSEKRIGELNAAGLDYLQISIDNVVPDEVSKKSLKVLDAKLQLLRGCAEFDVNINTVLGAVSSNPEDALVIGRRGQALLYGLLPEDGDPGLQLAHPGVGGEHPAGARLHGTGEGLGVHRRRDQQDRQLRVAVRQVADGVEDRGGAQVLVDQDHVELGVLARPVDQFRARVPGGDEFGPGQLLETRGQHHL